MFFETISNKTRMAIVESLLRGDKCVNDICADIHEEQSKVSHNLKRLTDCNIVNFRQEGKKRVYILNQETVVPILGLVDKHVHENCEVCKVKI